MSATMSASADTGGCSAAASATAAAGGCRNDGDCYPIAAMCAAGKSASFDHVWRQLGHAPRAWRSRSVVVGAAAAGAAQLDALLVSEQAQAFVGLGDNTRGGISRLCAFAAASFTPRRRIRRAPGMSARSLPARPRKRTRPRRCSAAPPRRKTDARPGPLGRRELPRRLVLLPSGAALPRGNSFMRAVAMPKDPQCFGVACRTPAASSRCHTN